MHFILFSSSIGILSLCLVSCINNKIEPHNKTEKLSPTKEAEREITTEPAKPLKVKWLIKSRDYDDGSLVHQVFLVVNGQEYQIDNEVYSMKDKSEYGPHNAEDIKAYQSMSGYNFEWHVSSINFYVKEEDGNLVVYAEESGDENEGRADTRKIKTITIQ